MTQTVVLTLVLGAAFLVSWLWRPRQALSPGVLMLLICYALLGGWALWFGLYAPPGQEPAGFLLWKPTVMYWVLAAILVAAPSLGWGYPAKAIIGTYFVFSNTEWRWINLCLAVACVLLGFLNLLAAFTSSTGEWEGIKWACLVNLVAIFLLRLTFLWLDTMVRAAVQLYGRARTFFQ
jgi:intracellular septation protein